MKEEVIIARKTAEEMASKVDKNETDIYNYDKQIAESRKIIEEYEEPEEPGNKRK